jgi:hypothetical protein
MIIILQLPGTQRLLPRPLLDAWVHAAASVFQAELPASFAGDDGLPGHRTRTTGRHAHVLMRSRSGRLQISHELLSGEFSNDPCFLSNLYARGNQRAAQRLRCRRCRRWATPLRTGQGKRRAHSGAVMHVARLRQNARSERQNVASRARGTASAAEVALTRRGYLSAFLKSLGSS